MDVANIASMVAPSRAASIKPAADTAQNSSLRDGESSRDGAASRSRLDSAVDDIQSFLQTLKRNLNFSIDESSGKVVVKVIDGDSGKVVRQMPSEDVLKLAARLDDMRSLMFEAHA
ncbi:flagellar protein FlaG [Pseudomonas schmalbachii]|uniref:Flagellar protein FlaG n=1 Tax=Pseudomonas schmalbachii TaxID=2816993 RepID=A0ABS3TTA2_9PSED|nr:flagellar protein FlaG [Pseudomonas schmalbachii]MBO3275789.1 flagellar protein FlaG [Pseudomonas schmalbachii]